MFKFGHYRTHQEKLESKSESEYENRRRDGNDNVDVFVKEEKGPGRFPCCQLGLAREGEKEKERGHLFSVIAPNNDNIQRGVFSNILMPSDIMTSSRNCV